MALAARQRPETVPDLCRALHDTFGFDTFRPLQEDAVRAALQGRDLLMVMPTGAGKSLCFQLPAALSPGLTVVVSPLIALMRDQVGALQERTVFGREGCAAIHSMQSSDDQREILRRLRGGQLRLIYTAPERFRSGGFMSALQSGPIARLVVDEAHCISEWGHDFRPDYLSLARVIETLGRPPLTAVTATATRRVQGSIVENLGMRNPAIFVGGFNRPNLHFSVQRCRTEGERDALLERALPRLASAGGSGIIYVCTRKQSESVAALAARALQAVGARAGPYHAGMESDERNRLQGEWLEGKVQVLAATSAFGMGIDKPDVRYVLHYGYPESLESYYQEAGRAGRDGRKSRCAILTHFSDQRTREWFIENESVTPETVQTAHAQLCRHVEATEEGDVAVIERTWWWRMLGWNDTPARLALGVLERTGLVERLSETSEETTWRVLQRDLPPKVLAQIAAALDRQRQERYRRLHEMLAYCKTTACRRTTLLSYFGDREKPQQAGYCCDNCETPAATRPAVREELPRAAMPATVDAANIHSVLQTLDSMRPQVGRARLNKVLRGCDPEYLERARGGSCPVYGIFKGCSQARVEEFVTDLIAQGLMRQGAEEEYFVCSVTMKGRAAWQSRTAVGVSIPTAASRQGVMDNPVTRRRFDALRAWRQTEARTHGLAAYQVMSDRALLEIAQQNPGSPESLGKITGIGEAKVRKYAAAILALLGEKG